MLYETSLGLRKSPDLMITPFSRTEQAVMAESLYVHETAAFYRL